MNGMERRLRRLEQDNDAGPVLVWREHGETVDEALARSGILPVDRRQAIILSWMEPQTDNAHSTRK